MTHLSKHWASLIVQAADAYVRKDRTDTVTGEKIVGPTHLWTGHQTLCGKRMKGFGLSFTDQPTGEVCSACRKHQVAGTAGAWRQ